jgi:hypothetical protein
MATDSNIDRFFVMSCIPFTSPRWRPTGWLSNPVELLSGGFANVIAFFLVHDVEVVSLWEHGFVSIFVCLCSYYKRFLIVL